MIKECVDACGQIETLRNELNACSANKDAQINSLSYEVHGMRGDFMRMDGDVKTLTKTMGEISNAVKTIADNTTVITEFIQLYNNFKGFIFVMKHGGKILVALAAVLAALVYLNGLQLHIG